MTDPNRKAQPREVRKWAQERGFTVSDRGRLPEHVKEAFTEATGRPA